MISRFMLLAALVLGTSAAVGADTDELKEGQPPSSVSGAASPAGTGSTTPAKDVAEASAAQPVTHAAIEPATPVPSSAPAKVTPPAATASEPITLKVATVPPPEDFKVPAGYRAVKRGLDTVYCTSSTPIGSRMPEKICYSREQLEAIERQAEANRREMYEKTHTGGTSGG
jgi:hypothetical protein